MHQLDEVVYLPYLHQNRLNQHPPTLLILSLISLIDETCEGFTEISYLTHQCLHSSCFVQLKHLLFFREKIFFLNYIFLYEIALMVVLQCLIDYKSKQIWSL